MTPREISAELRQLGQTGSVLYVAAHPDDENTQLIAYLARGRGYRTAYLSLTRGDGGQNVLGPEFGEKLGVARTQELLAARRLDGGEQYFTRAVDFGFSKDYQETLKIWDREKVLSDIVRVIREFQPDVIVTRFSTKPGGTHGHHTASAVLALEAFNLSGNPKAFPEQLKLLKPWQAKRILWNGFNRGGTDQIEPLRIDSSGTDAGTGISFAELAGRSRSQHKTQGFGGYTGGGADGPHWETFALLAGSPTQKDILDDVDTTWSRYPGAEPLVAQSSDIASHFDFENPSASVPALFAFKRELLKLPADALVSAKQLKVDRLIQACLGITVQSTVDPAEAVAGETIKLSQSVTVTGKTSVHWDETRFPSIHQAVRAGMELHTGDTQTRDTDVQLPASTPISQPYWLREYTESGTFSVADPEMIGKPENPPVLPVDFVFQVAGNFLVVRSQATGRFPEGAPTELREPLSVIPPISLRFVSEVRLFRPGGSNEVEVEVTAARNIQKGSVRLILPSGWISKPKNAKFDLAKAGESFRIHFTVTAPPTPTVASLGVQASVGGKTFEQQRVDVRYAHIPPQLLQPSARMKAVAMNLEIHGKRVGYLPGAGDNVAEALRLMGYEVIALTGEDLNSEKLGGLDAVVVGVRALNVRSDLSTGWPALLKFAENGGNVVLQYNNPNKLKVEHFAPGDLQISSDRVTDETAAMTFLAPENAVLNSPNKITEADFDGWVQERGLYFPNRWDARFVPILACNDPGDKPMKGSLLVASIGRGHFIYTGLAFFRQLPAGVPGAYRLFANLVSIRR